MLCLEADPEKRVEEIDITVSLVEHALEAEGEGSFSWSQIFTQG